MSLITAVSFDADGIRVITADKSGKSLTVKNAVTLNETELDTFLSSDSSQEYLVVTNFADALFETITIPPVEQKLVAQLVMLELRKLHPEMPPFTCSWRIIADIPQEGRTIRKVACCLVDNSILTEALTPFIRNKKAVRNMVALPHALTAMLDASSTATDDALLCAYDGKKQKTIFVIEHGAVTFVRQVASEGFGWNEFDIQNISMTLDYCFQALRVRPSRTIALNTASPPEPLNDFELPPDLSAQPDLPEFQHLLAALLYQLPQEQRLLPADYKKELSQQDILSLGTKGFALASIIALFIISYFLFSVHALKKEISTMRLNNGTLTSAIASYNAAYQERSSIEPLVNAISANSSTPSVTALLKLLPTPPAPPSSLRTLQIKQEKEGMTLQLTGTIVSSSYATTQEIFEQYAQKLSSVQGVSITSKKLDTKDHSFVIEAGYKP